MSELELVSRYIKAPTGLYSVNPARYQAPRDASIHLSILHQHDCASYALIASGSCIHHWDDPGYGRFSRGNCLNLVTICFCDCGMLQDKAIIVSDACVCVCVCVCVSV